MSLSTFLKWAARICSVLVVATFLMILVSEFIPPFHSGPPQRPLEWLGISLCILAALGLAVSFRHERVGAVMTLSALAAFSMAITMPDQRIVLAFAVPSVLFLAHSFTISR